MMAEIKIHVFHTGEVCVAPDLPFGGEHCSTIKASGAFAKKSERLWLPVSAYLIECSHGKIIFDCGWHRNMSPDGVFDKKAQIKSLGSLPLYVTNQGRIEKGLAIDEQLAALGIHPADLDLVLLSHLDCDHTNGLNLVADAKQILVSKRRAAFCGEQNARQPHPLQCGLVAQHENADLRLERYGRPCGKILRCIWG